MQRGVQLFLAWAVMQGFAMLLQNRYQRQRLYTRIALGKVVLHPTVLPLFKSNFCIGNLIIIIFLLKKYSEFVFRYISI